MKFHLIAGLTCLIIGTGLWACPSVPNQSLETPELSCHIDGPTAIRVNTVPEIRVRIKNEARYNVSLVGAIDGSSSFMRYPQCDFEIRGPDGDSSVKLDGLTICGTVNALKESDFVEIGPGQFFDPYDETPPRSVFRAIQLRASSFDAPGLYRIRFHYSTASSNDGEWLGMGSMTPALHRKVAGVPKVTLMSNEIQIQVNDSDR